jgi:hypothetical protein
VHIAVSILRCLGLAEAVPGVGFLFARAGIAAALVGEFQGGEDFIRVQVAGCFLPVTSLSYSML